MKILLTGSTGYIGNRLLPMLIEMGHEVLCLTRKPHKLKNIIDIHKKKIQIIICDLEEEIPDLPLDVDAAYYLIHSMSGKTKEFEEKEEITAKNFLLALEKTKASQIIYLGALITSCLLSPHLRSRLKVEKLLSSSSIPLTTLRSGIIIGSGSAPFEIIRDLSEKLPIILAPKWIENLCQPIGIDDALYYLLEVLGKKLHYHKIYDIGGPDILSYKQMLRIYPKKRNLKRLVFQMSLLSPRICSYGLQYITSTNPSLALALVESMKNNAICTENGADSLLPHKCLSYEKAVERALHLIAQTSFFSTLGEAREVIKKNPLYEEMIRIPQYGCYHLTFKHTMGAMNLEKLLHLHPKWHLIKKTPDHLIFYKNNRKEYWIEYTLENQKILKKLWHRPKGLLQRALWFCFSPFLKYLNTNKEPKIKFVHISEEQKS